MMNSAGAGETFYASVGVPAYQYAPAIPEIASEFQFIDVGGVKIRYLDVGPREGDSILFLHGVGGSLATWFPILPSLAGEFRCVALDLPGFGESGRPPGTLASAKVAEILDDFCQELALDRASVCGHSMGGLEAVEFANAHSTRVKLLVLLSAHLFSALDVFARPISFLLRRPAGGLLFVAQIFTLSIPWPEGWRRAVLRDVRARRMILGKFVARPDDLSDQSIDRIAERFSNRSVRAVLVNGVGYSYQAELGRLNCPVRVIAGAEDRLASLRDLELMHVTLPDAAITVVEGAGHWVQLEAPYQVAEIIRNAALEPDTAQGRL